MALVGVGRLLSEAFWPIAQVPLAVEVVDQKGSPLSLSPKIRAGPCISQLTELSTYDSRITAGVNAGEFIAIFDLFQHFLCVESSAMLVLVTYIK